MHGFVPFMTGALLAYGHPRNDSGITILADDIRAA